MQTKLDVWFGGIKPVQLEERFLFLEWKDGKSQPEQFAQWITKEEYSRLKIRMNINKTIHSKNQENEKIRVTICGILPVEKSLEPTFYDLDKIERRWDFKEWKNASLLKSYLQKCVRRGWTDHAIRCSYHLMRLNMMEFLRRFPIISVEDSSTHPDMSTIVWFMAIGDIPYRIEYIRYFLGIVYYVASSKERRIDLPDKTLELRIAFGGMKGDMKMLSRYLSKQKGNISYDKIRPVRIEKYLGMFDMDRCGADFHVYPGMVDHIKNDVLTDAMLNIDTEDIKKTIWYCSSGINHRDSNKQINRYLK